MAQPSHDLSGKVMFVTGAGRGIGRGIAEVAAECGADVAINALTDRYVNDLAERIASETGKRVVPIIGDVTTPAGARTAVEAVVQEFGRIDVLVNNLGDAIAKPLVALPGDERLAMTDEEVETVMGLNLSATIACTRAAGAAMLERRHDHQYRRNGRACGRRQHRHLHDGEDRPHRIHESPRARVGALWGSRERGRPWELP
jgi:NAD(P)-dependent dehydrogenase (short-subunit alcohol dehydrogenase family)